MGDVMVVDAAATRAVAHTRTVTGRYLEEFEQGACFTTVGRTIVEADVALFAGLTGDFMEIHTNEVYARSTSFGQRIVHGALVFSMSVGLTTRTNLVDGTLLAFRGVDCLRFTRPVLIGDTIRVTKTVIETVAQTADSGTIAFDSRVWNQRDQVVLAYVDRLLLKRRPGQPPTARSEHADAGGATSSERAAMKATN